MRVKRRQNRLKRAVWTRPINTKQIILRVSDEKKYL